MIWFFGIPALAAMAWGIVRKSRGKSKGDGETTAIALGSIFLGLLVVICGAVSLVNHNGLAKWEAFYNANAANYEIAVDRTASYLSEQTFVEDALIPVEGTRGLRTKQNKGQR